MHDYLHHSEFRTAVLNDTDNLTRVTIGKALDARIEKETIAWQNKHIDEIFQNTIMKDLKKKFENIHRTLHSIKDNLKGMKTPFDVENRITTAIASGVIPSGAGLLGSFLINRKVSNSGVMIGIATAGILNGIFSVFNFYNTSDMSKSQPQFKYQSLCYYKDTELTILCHAKDASCFCFKFQKLQ